ncbi:unknown [Firmicutes bacterium CAG:449]|nr:unknown [Firmicutes bacterium CAG:449]
MIAVGAVVGGTVAGVNSYNNGNTGWELVGDVLGGALIGGAIGGIVGYFAAPGIAAMLSSTGTIGGALAFAGGMGSTGAGIAISSVGQLALAGAVTSVGVLSGITVMAAQTRKSGGYYGERWPGDPHKPDHVHLRGNGIDIRIGRDGKPLPGEDKLGSQARKALERLWDEFVKLFNRW